VIGAEIQGEEAGGHSGGQSVPLQEEEAELQQQRQPGGEGSLLLQRPSPGEWGDRVYAKLNQESSRLRVTR